MASLTETAIVVRKLIVIAIGFMIVLVLGLYGWRYYGILTKEKPKPTLPTLRWSKLYPPSFPKTSFKNAAYTLETATGGYPNYPLIATVSGLRQSKLSFASRENIVSRARRLEFLKPLQQSSQATLTFTDDQLPLRTLTAETATGNFTYKYDYQKDPSVFNVTQEFNESRAIETANRFFDKWGDFPADYSDGEHRTEYLEWLNGQLIPTTRKQDANAIRVNYFRKDLFGSQVKFANPHESPTYVIIGQSVDPKRQVLEAQLQYYEITSPPPSNDGHDLNATYFIKPPEQAYTELSGGKAYIAESDNSNTIPITLIEFAFYEDDTQKFIYPIYVFSGESFTAYVSALVDQQFSAREASLGPKATSQAGSGELVKGIATKQPPSPKPIVVLPPQSGSGSPTVLKRFVDLLATWP